MVHVREEGKTERALGRQQEQTERTEARQAAAISKSGDRKDTRIAKQETKAKLAIPNSLKWIAGILLMVFLFLMKSSITKAFKF